MRNVIHFQDRDGQIARVWQYSGRRNSFVKFTARDVHIDQRGRLFRWKEYGNTLGWLVKGQFAVQLWDRGMLVFPGELELSKYLHANKFLCIGVESRESTALAPGSVQSDVVKAYWNNLIGDHKVVITVFPTIPQPVKLDIGPEFEKKLSEQQADGDAKERETVVPFDQAIEGVLCTRLSEHIKFVFDWYERFDDYDDLKVRVLASRPAKDETQNRYFSIGLILLNTIRLVNNGLYRLGIRPNLMP